MRERILSEDKAREIIGLWQAEERPVEVLVRFSQGLRQSHPGRVTIEPEGQIVVADIVDKDHYMTTVLDITAFETIKLSETESVVTCEEPFDTSGTFRSVTLACRE